MKIAVLGYGIIGKAIKQLLDNSHLSSRMSPLGKRIEVTAYDIIEQPNCTKITRVKEVTSNNDLVICSTPYNVNKQVAKSCTKNNCHYIDLTEDTENTEYIRRIANKQMFIPQCGLAPGAVNIIANNFANKLDVVDSIKIRVGALPKHPTNIMKYNFTWSPEGVINEYCNPCDAIVDGEKVITRPLEGYENLFLNGKQFEAFNTSGGAATLVETWEGKVQNLDYKTIRYVGHHHLMKFLLEDMNMANNKQQICDLLKQKMLDKIEDIVYILVKVSGILNDKKVEHVYQKSIEGSDGLSAIQLTTAAGACSWVSNIVDEDFKGSGFIRQEDLDYELFVSNKFGGIYK
jgi:saccharopine dehydrogenase-like NADP-dependent oxidoreductase